MNRNLKIALYSVLWPISLLVLTLLCRGGVWAVEVSISEAFYYGSMPHTPAWDAAAGFLALLASLVWFERVNRRALAVFLENDDPAFVEPGDALMQHLSRGGAVEMGIWLAESILFSLVAIRVPLFRWCALFYTSLMQMMGVVPGLLLAGVCQCLLTIFSIYKAQNFWRLLVINDKIGKED